MDIKDIQHLIKFVAKSGVQEVKLEMENVKITIKTGSNPQKVKQDLLQHNVITEDVGGEVVSVEVSALKKTNIDDLLIEHRIPHRILQLAIFTLSLIHI